MKRLRFNGFDVGLIARKRFFDGWEVWFCDAGIFFNIVSAHPARGSRFYTFLRRREQEAVELFDAMNENMILQADLDIVRVEEKSS